MIWRVQSVDREQVQKLAQVLGVGPALSRVLVQRGYSQPDSARRFLEAGPSFLHDPYLLADMDKAVGRLERAFRQKERIFVFGDYDVDGVTSIAALTALLEVAGVPFAVHQPNRLQEGYGLSEEGVELARRAGCSLLIVLDCGTEAAGAVERANQAGMDVIVIDHHRQRGPLPPALAVLNPCRDDSDYPFRELAAVGVVFKFLQAGEPVWKVPLPWERFWQLAALGTVADVAPLVDENRVFVRTGLGFLRQNRDPSFRALIEVSRLDPRRLNTRHLSFQLAPRLNAAGRMGIPELGRKLLRSRDGEEIARLASELEGLNRRRQAIQAAVWKEVEDKIESRPEKFRGKVIVVAGETWNKGVIGIVASKVQEKYYRPAVVITEEGELGIGSARSIPGFNLFSAISRCGHILEKFGGHKYAAGIILKRERIDEFRRRLDQIAGELLSEEDLVPQLKVDAELNFSEATLDLIRELEKCEPFGLGNPVPIFLTTGIRLQGNPSVIGKDKTHLKMQLQKGSICRQGVGWGMAARRSELDCKHLDVVYQLKVDEWGNRQRIQLVLKDFREHRSS